ncbi:glutamate--cysteine ligase [Actinopolymorpha sp. NPDC004070]|uniref:glutamate--cysteine ligase n=1 Tax=Actinopolymorpha sp. NPDC004070 TaxID=3154548 RepID=UPI0033A9B3C1
MGQDIKPRAFSPEDRALFRDKLRRCLRAFVRMSEEGRFEVRRPFTGFEIEFNLVDERGDPSMTNSEVLAAIDDESFQTELAQYNVEINVEPRRLRGSALREFEDDLLARLETAGAKARAVGPELVMVGILPTVTPDHMGAETLSPKVRYRLLNEQIITERGENIRIGLEGVEKLELTTDSVVPESACTSTQLHVEVSEGAFPAYWNAAQAIAGPQVAVCANSPFLFQKELWRETRIKLFEQSIDTRSVELTEQGVRPRVWFGERWLESVTDLFEENQRYFSPLLPEIADEDPLEVLDRGGTPRLAELCLHGGTIYRWNRPVYDIADGRPHLRIENRILPAGPTVIDTMANAAFYFGLVRRLAADEQPVWSRLSFEAAEDNFLRGAREGIGARLHWPGLGEVGAAELTLGTLLPLAHEGLDRWGVDPADRDRLLGVIEQRCRTGRNGAEWQAAVFHRLHDGSGLSRLDALRAMTARYVEHMRSNAPVHTWPLD